MNRLRLIDTFDVDLGLSRVICDTANLISDLDHRKVDFLNSLNQRNRPDFGLRLLWRGQSHLELVKGSAWDLFSGKEAPDLLIDVMTDCALNLLQDEVQEVGIIRFEEADVVGGVDEGIAGHLDMELILHVSLKIIKEVSDDLLRLAFHLDVIHFRDKNNVVITDLQAKIWRYKKRFSNV